MVVVGAGRAGPRGRCPGAPWGGGGRRASGPGGLGLCELGTVFWGGRGGRRLAGDEQGGGVLRGEGRGAG